MLAMEILFISPYVPNLMRVRPYQIIRALTERGHRVTVLTLWVNVEEQAEIEQLKQFCAEVHALPMPIWRSLWNCLKMVPGREPLQAVFSWHPSLIASYLKNSCLRFDVVHVEHLRGSRYGLAFKRQTNLPVVWDSVDCITHLFTQAAAQSQNRLRRWRSKFELNRTRRYESWLVSQFDRILVTSPTDREALQKIAEGTTSSILVVPNGVDLEYFCPDPDVTREPATLIVSGKMSYHANINMALYMAREIMPSVWRHNPDVRLNIVGKDPTPEVEQLGSHPNITVTGTVAHLPPYLQQATIAVAPIKYSAGIQNKVLEAMACATPMITTPQAIASLNVEPGHNILVAETASDFARQILKLLAEPDKRNQLGQNGRAYVESHHRWSEVGRQLEQIYAEVLRSNHQEAISGMAPSLATIE